MKARVRPWVVGTVAGAGALGLLILLRRRAAASPPPVTPASPPPKPSPMQAPSPPDSPAAQPEAASPAASSYSGGTAEHYQTPPSEVVLHQSGLFTLPNGRRVSRLPLVDRRTGLFARLSYRGALEAARLLSREHSARVEIISPDDAQAYWDLGLRIKAEPCQLVRGTQAEQAAAVTRMQSIDFAEREDACILKQIEAAGWDQQQPVANAGKWWVSGAPAGRAYLMGWWSPSGKLKQPRPGVGSSGPHDDGHFDYGTLTNVVFPP